MEPRVDEVWLHGEGWTDRITAAGVFRLLFEEARVIAVVGVEGGQLQVERWAWDGGVPVRGDIPWVSEDRAVSLAKAAEIDDGVGCCAYRRSSRSPRELTRTTPKRSLGPLRVPANSSPTRLASTTGCTGARRSCARAMSSSPCSRRG